MGLEWEEWFGFKTNRLGFGTERFGVGLKERCGFGIEKEVCV